MQTVTNTEIEVIESRQTSGSAGPIGWAELGLVPDRVIRAGIRRLNRQRLEDIHADDPEVVPVLKAGGAVIELICTRT